MRLPGIDLVFDGEAARTTDAALLEAVTALFREGGWPAQVEGDAITAPFSAGAWFIQGVAAAVATIVTLPFGALVGVLLYVDLRARKERLDLDTLTTDLQTSAA